MFTNNKWQVSQFPWHFCSQYTSVITYSYIHMHFEEAMYKNDKSILFTHELNW